MTKILSINILLLFIINGNAQEVSGSKVEASILGLRTTVYKVADLTGAKKWYTKAFQTEPYFDEPYYVGYNIGGFELALQPEDQPAHKGENVITYWGVDDIEKTYSRLLDLGAKTHEKPNHVGSDIMVASVKDPFDNVVGIIYNPHFTLKE